MKIQGGQFIFITIGIHVQYILNLNVKYTASQCVGTGTHIINSCRFFTFNSENI